MRKNNLWLTIAFSLSLLTRAFAAESVEPKNLAGLWEAKRIFGPELKGTILVKRQKDKWAAGMESYTAAGKVEASTIRFDFPDHRGSLTATIKDQKALTDGFWVQPTITHNGMSFASPVKLSPCGKDCWSGEVVPLTDEFTLYLNLSAREDGSLGAFIRNPDRNVGLWMNASRLEMNGTSLKLIGTWLRNKNEVTLAEGTYDPEEDRISLYIPGRGGTYDFSRIDDQTMSPYYARGKTPPPYQYEPPSQESDGWPVGNLEDAGMDLAPIKDLIEKFIEAPADSVHSQYVHGFLIARHGKLVLEEYFHGFSKDIPHDTRSASKSATSTLVGAAMENGAAFNTSSSVYRIIYGKNLPAGIDPRKMHITVEHLLTMASGFDCDDSNDDSPGNEDHMQEQTEDLDWYHYTLNLPMAREPGEKSIYCSINPNLLGDVLISATGKTLPELFQTLIADPLEIKNYWLFLQPTGQPYLGGGTRFLPRDFMKFGQVLLNGGTWKNHRILQKSYVDRAISPVVHLGDSPYGYLWWQIDYPYKGRTVHAFYAGGNGGQVVLGIPELDLLVCFYAGNYGDRVMFKIQNELVPQYILPALH